MPLCEYEYKHLSFSNRSKVTCLAGEQMGPVHVDTRTHEDYYQLLNDACRLVCSMLRTAGAAGDNSGGGGAGRSLAGIKPVRRLRNATSVGWLARLNSTTCTRTWEMAVSSQRNKQRSAFLHQCKVGHWNGIGERTSGTARARNRSSWMREDGNSCESVELLARQGRLPHSSSNMVELRPSNRLEEDNTAG